MMEELGERPLTTELGATKTGLGWWSSTARNIRWAASEASQGHLQDFCRDSEAGRSMDVLAIILVH